MKNAVDNLFKTCGNLGITKQQIISILLTALVASLISFLQSIIQALLNFNVPPPSPERAATYAGVLKGGLAIRDYCKLNV